MRGRIFSAALAAVLLAFGSVAKAQTTANPPPASATVGGVYVPSTHSPGCAGLLCDGNDPRVLARTPPPPCQGVLCGMTPYAMERPVTAADAARMQEQAAQNPAPPVAAPAPKNSRKQRKARAKSAKAEAVASRTPEPAAPGPQ